MELQFSIIISVYNGEKIITNCLNSLIGQDYPCHKYEIIVVDDCSTDNTPNIIKDYINDKKTTPNPPVIKLLLHNVNKKQGGGRNTGLKNAKGNWIFFLDADDFWLYDNVLSIFDEFIKNNSNIDLIRSISAKVNTTNYIPLKNYNNDIAFQTVDSRQYFMSEKFTYEVWSICYKKEFLDKINIHFVENMFYEDTKWTTEIMYKGERILLIDFPFYGYYNNPNSTTRSKSIQPFLDNAKSTIEVQNIIENINDEEYKKTGYNRIRNTILSLVKQSKNLPTQKLLPVFYKLKERGLLKRNLYSLNLIQNILFILMKTTPGVLLYQVKLLTIIKRIFK